MMLTIPLLAGIVLTYGSCTRTITRGQYGPFTIGESRQASLAAVKRLGVHVEGEPYDTIRIERPTPQDLQRLRSSPGIMVRLQNSPAPLRIEFEGERVVRLWPEYDHPHAPAYVQAEDAEYRRLRDQLRLGMVHDEVLLVVGAFASVTDVTVENFVPGFDRYRSGVFQRDAEYDALLLRTDVWKFDGLDELVWYDPWYSRVTLYFENNALERIEHWAFPFELCC